MNYSVFNNISKRVIQKSVLMTDPNVCNVNSGFCEVELDVENSENYYHFEQKLQNFTNSVTFIKVIQNLKLEQLNSNTYWKYRLLCKKITKMKSTNILKSIEESCPHELEPISDRAQSAEESVSLKLDTQPNSKNKKSCLVIYTGGTFGMTPDKNGTLHPTTGFLERKISEMDEFSFKGMPHVTVIEWEDPIDSSDMVPEDWIQLAETVKENYWDYDGFVILQGTDTMAYTASALSFMLENLGKPVVLAGAMIPLHFPHSDARRNLVLSILCATSLDIPEVCIYSNNQILRGNRTTKVSNMAINAFQSPNFPVLARTDVETIVDYTLILPHPRRRFTICTDLVLNVCVFRLVPGFDDACFSAYIQQQENCATSKSDENMQPRACVLALYGTGNAPLRKSSFLDLVKRAVACGISVTITSQCISGRTKLDAYATGVALLNMGVIVASDMTIESIVTKLAYLMGKGLCGDELKKKMETNIRGELTTRSSAAEATVLSSQSTENIRHMVQQMYSN